MSETRGGHFVPGALASAAEWCGRNRHFVVAVVLLSASAMAINFLEWGKRLPVPWPPDDVNVTGDLRMTSLPVRVGDFEAVGTDRYGNKYDGGVDMILSEDVLKALAIGTSQDKNNLSKRCSNWYVSREYRDTSIENENSPFARWSLQVCYYTGIRDKVPHVPERCMAASGFVVQKVQAENFKVIAAGWPWDKGEIKFNRVTAQRFNQKRNAADNTVAFYVFSLNGWPETSWEKIRLHLALTMEPYSYFAKIQFSPTGDVTGYDNEEIHARAAKFLEAVLPGIIKRLPTVEDVEKLRESYKD